MCIYIHNDTYVCIYMHACIHTYIDLYMFIGLHIYRVSWLILIFSAENFPYFTLHSAKISRTKFSAFYPLAIFCIPHFTLTHGSQPVGRGTLVGRGPLP